MILFTTLLGLFILLAIILLTTTLIGGAGFIAIFGDVIVCGCIIGLIVALVRKLKKKK